MGDMSWEPPQLAVKNDGKATIVASSAPQPVLTANGARKAPPPREPEPAKHTSTTSQSRKLELLLEADPPAPVGSKPQAGNEQPFHVGKGIEIPDSALTLQAEAAAPAVAAKPVNQGAAPAVATKAAPKAPPAAPPAPAKSVAAAAQLVKTPPHPDLDSTQTIRALTSAELNDEQQEKWFAIQLAASEQPVNLDAMPHLDIFEAYRLYSIATAGSGKIIHSLRLGFFKEAVSAEAVSGYLKTFFPSPSVLRISVAEHSRFKDPPAAPKNTRPAEEAKVIEITSARHPRPVIPTVTVEVDPGATGSFRPNATGSFNANATGSFRANATGSFDPSATGTFKPNATGSFKTSGTGKHKTLKPAAKHAGLPSKSSEHVRNRAGTTGKHRVPVGKKSLSEQLLDEARQVELSESGIRKLPKNDSLLSRMLGKLTK